MLNSICLHFTDKGLKALLNKQVQICKEGIARQDQQLSKAYRGMFDRHNAAKTDSGVTECVKPTSDKNG